MQKVQLGWIIQETKKLVRPFKQTSPHIVHNFITNNVLYVDTSNADVVPVHFDPTEISDDLTSTPLTNDLYSLDINDEEHILAEFPVLRSDSVPSQASKSKPEQNRCPKGSP